MAPDENPYLRIVNERLKPVYRKMKQTSHALNIIGAGLAGSLLSVLLAQRGYKVHVFERRPDMRRERVDAGRSINLALSARGMHALSHAGMLESVMEVAIPMYGRMMHNEGGELTFQPYSKDRSNCIYSVSRAELNIRLMNMTEPHPHVSYRFNCLAESIDERSGAVELRDLVSGERFEAPGRVTLACDGAYSAVRYDLQKMPRFNLSQEHLDYGYKELTIPPAANGDFCMDPHALHIWPRGNFMMIALPNQDTSFTCTLFMPFTGADSFERLDTREAVQAFFDAKFPDAVPLMPELAKEFFENPTGSLVTIRCFPWAAGGSVLLLGDAAHAIVPFFGQGMNAAFEDCSVLLNCIDETGPEWRAVFEAFQARRKPDADAIADMALENFIEMRDLVADEAFLKRKQLEHALERHFPQYKSRYEMVSFSRIPYAEAYRRGEINRRMLDELMRNAPDATHPDWALAESLLRTHYPAE